MAVYDCMHFWVENDLLEIRINEYWDKVDKFIIVEAGETHTGKPKPYNFDHERFAPYMDKIVYRTFDSFDQAFKDYPHLVDEYLFHDRGPNKNNMDWVRDHFQCNFTLEVLNEIGADDNDVVFISCPDEILRKEAVAAATEMIVNSNPDSPPIIMFKYDLFAYKLNLLNKTWQESDSTGQASRCSTFRKTLPATLRGPRACTHIMNNAGWHFCFMDGKSGEDVLAKQQAWAHSRDVEPGKKIKYENSNTEEALIRLFDDYPVRKVSMEVGVLPEYVVNNQEKYLNYIFHEDLE